MTSRGSCYLMAVVDDAGNYHRSRLGGLGAYGLGGLGA